MAESLERRALEHLLSTLVVGAFAVPIEEVARRIESLYRPAPDERLREAAKADRRTSERRIGTGVHHSGCACINSRVWVRCTCKNRRIATEDRRVDWKAKYEAMHMVAKELALHLRSSEFYGWKCETLIHCSPVAQKVLDKFAALEEEQNG